MFDFQQFVKSVSKVFSYQSSFKESCLAESLASKIAGGTTFFSSNLKGKLLMTMLIAKKSAVRESMV